MAKRFRQHRPTVRDGAVALRDHIRAVAATARERHGPMRDAATTQRVLDDRTIVRYPVTLAFDARPLEPGEFAFVQPRGGHPGEGFTLFVHPDFAARPDAVPLLVAYHLVRINYGDIATHEDAEIFGAGLCAMDEEAYYDAICALADTLPLPVNG